MAAAELDDLEEKWAGEYASIAPAWRRAWQEVIPFFGFDPAIRNFNYTTDEMDKRFVSVRGSLEVRRRPRGEARRIGCKRRQPPMDALPI
jgi:putative transposase